MYSDLLASAEFDTEIESRKGPAHEICWVSVFAGVLLKLCDEVRRVSYIAGLENTLLKKMHAFVTTPIPNIYRKSI